MTLFPSRNEEDFWRKKLASFPLSLYFSSIQRDVMTWSSSLLVGITFHLPTGWAYNTQWASAWFNPVNFWFPKNQYWEKNYQTHKKIKILLKVALAQAFFHRISGKLSKWICRNLELFWFWLSYFHQNAWVILVKHARVILWQENLHDFDQNAWVFSYKNAFC